MKHDRVSRFYHLLSKGVIISEMGFPEWTLWGMGISASVALLFLIISLLSQSPGFLTRIGLRGARMERRVRAYNGYALAMLLLAIGFFLAGVPLGDSAESTEQPNGTPISEGSIAPGATTETPITLPIASNTPTSTRATPSTGAFGGPPTITLTVSNTVEATEASGESPTSTPTATGTTVRPSTILSPTAVTTPTATPTTTPSPTATPTPTLTPTPILQATGVVTTAGSTIWLRQSPGGQNLTLISDGDKVILGTGHASQGGTLWREVMTLDGIIGWIREEFLDTTNTGSDT